MTVRLVDYPSCSCKIPKGKTNCHSLNQDSNILFIIPFLLNSRSFHFFIIFSLNGCYISLVCRDCHLIKIQHIKPFCIADSCEWIILIYMLRTCWVWMFPQKSRTMGCWLTPSPGILCLRARQTGPTGSVPSGALGLCLTNEKVHF